VDVDAAATADARGGRDGDVSGPFEGAKEAPKDSGGAVAEDRGVAAGEDSGHEAPVQAQGAVADSVDAAVNPMEMPALHSISYRACTKSRLFELHPRHHAVLASGGYRHPKIGRVAFLTHVGA
jgi:hypothetical protein